MRIRGLECSVPILKSNGVKMYTLILILGPERNIHEHIMKKQAKRTSTRLAVVENEQKTRPSLVRQSVARRV